jgi:4a-hydroxytetrahydrobiopterin dehydratase
MPRDKVTEDALQEHLRTHGEWSLLQGALRREYTFPNFVTAFGFMAQAALIAERMNHHPEWTNVYNRVHVTLETHDVGGLTADDLALSAAMDGIAAHLPAPGSSS